MLGAKQTRDETLAGPTLGRPVPEVHTILGRGARFDGKLHFEGSVQIDGRFEGEIHTEGTLIVGRDAEVKAKLEVGSVVIHGSVEGDITAREGVEIKAPGRLKGNVTTPSLVIEKGVLFDGACSMADAQPDRRTSDLASPPPPPLPQPPKAKNGLN